MIDFLKQNWQWLVSVLISLIIFIIQVIKRKIKVSDTALTDTLRRLPGWILDAETKYKDGKAKKLYVVTSALDYYLSVGGVRASNDVSNIISEEVENILCTPSKKEVF